MIEEAVVLAAGEGHRLRPLTHTRPKPMLPAANRPILCYVFDSLIDAGVTTITVVVGYKSNAITEYFGHQYRGIPIRYFTQSKQLGSGHALLQASDTINTPVLCVNGDQIVSPHLLSDVVAKADHDQEADAWLAARGPTTNEVYDSVSMTGDRVTRISDPGRSRYSLINAGVYVLTNTILNQGAVAERVDGELGLPSILSTLIAAGSVVKGVRTSGLWIDATHPWELLTVMSDLFSVNWVSAPRGPGGVNVAATASIHDTATLIPPVIVDRGCSIGPEAVIGPSTVLRRNGTVEPNAVIQQSIVGADTVIGAHATLERSVLGQHVTIGAKTVLPSGRATVPIAGTVHNNLRAGSIIADNTHVGGVTTFEPGSLVGPDVTVDSDASVSGVVPANAHVVR